MLTMYGQSGQFATETLKKRLKGISYNYRTNGIDFNFDQLKSQFGKSLTTLPILVDENNKVLSEDEILKLINGDVVIEEVEKPKTRKRKTNEGAD